MKQSMQDLIMITGVLVVLSGIFALGAGMPSQADTASDIREILSAPRGVVVASK